MVKATLDKKATFFFFEMIGGCLTPLPCSSNALLCTAPVGGGGTPTLSSRTPPGATLLGLELAHTLVHMCARGPPMRPPHHPPLASPFGLSTVHQVLTQVAAGHPHSCRRGSPENHTPHTDPPGAGRPTFTAVPRFSVRFLSPSSALRCVLCVSVSRTGADTRGVRDRAAAGCPRDRAATREALSSVCHVSAVTCTQPPWAFPF